MSNKLSVLVSVKNISRVLWSYWLVFVFTFLDRWSQLEVCVCVSLTVSQWFCFHKCWIARTLESINSSENQYMCVCVCETGTQFFHHWSFRKTCQVKDQSGRSMSDSDDKHRRWSSFWRVLLVLDFERSFDSIKLLNIYASHHSISRSIETVLSALSLIVWTSGRLFGFNATLWLSKR